MVVPFGRDKMQPDLKDNIRYQEGTLGSLVGEVGYVPTTSPSTKRTLRKETTELFN